MGWIYDQNVIYGSKKSNYNSFDWNGFKYYTTKTGIAKKQKFNEKAVKVANEEYNAAWEQYKFTFIDQ